MTLLHNPFVLLAFLCILAACACVNTADETVTVRVASYNVEFSKNASPEQIGEMFTPYNLDLIGFDEAPDGEWTDRVGKVLGMKYSYVGKISSANHKDKYKTILCRTPLEKTAEFPLNGSGWNPASTVKVVTRIDGLPIAFYSLHICASGSDDGHAADLATNVLPQETTERFIVVGDFNNKIGDAAMNIIEKAGMRPTWKDLKMDIANRFTWNALNPKENLGVIDHILYNTASGANAVDGGIIELKQPLSDHHPIWAELIFPRKIIKKDAVE